MAGGIRPSGVAYWAQEVVDVSATQVPQGRSDPQPDDLEHRVHVDLPRVRPEEMVATHPTTPPPDPEGGRDTESDFLLRNAGW